MPFAAHAGGAYSGYDSGRGLENDFLDKVEFFPKGLDPVRVCQDGLHRMAGSVAKILTRTFSSSSLAAVSTPNSRSPKPKRRKAFSQQVKALGIQEVLGAPQQRAYIERVIGTNRRECLDHVIVFNEASLCRHLKMFLEYYHQSRTHLSLEKDTPESRSVQPPETGRVVAVPQIGGLHHRYERRAA
jgi:hypothetical protein